VICRSGREGIRPLTLFGQCTVGAAWVNRAARCTYKELAGAPAGFLGPVITIHQIWVDSAPAALGGRKLRGIPKQLASFDLRSNAAFEGSVERYGQPIAVVRFASRFMLPGRWSFD
jgi:hypothetical protein